MNVTEAIDRLRRRDISGLGALVAGYQVQAVRAAFLITQDRAMAEDVVADAFLRVYERVQQYDSRRPFRAWFLRIVVNDAIKSAARQSRQVSLDQTPNVAEEPLAARLPNEDAGPQEMAERAETRRAVGEALRRLSPSQRAAIVMRYYLGMSEGEIAGRFQRTPGTVKRHLHDGRKRLQLLLAGPGSVVSPHQADVIEQDRELSPRVEKGDRR